MILRPPKIQMSTNPEIELAQLSLTGRRYGEAEERFTRLLSSPDAPQAWLGLGLAKLGKLPSGKCTPEEVAFCVNKALALEPNRREEACLMVMSATKAMLEEVSTLIPELFAFEDAAAKARGRALLNKGFAYMRGTGMFSGNSGPTLFTSLDSLHDSYRGSVLVDASSELRGNARQLGDYLRNAIINIRSAITLVVPKEFPGRDDCLAAADKLTVELALPVEMRRANSLPTATPELYQQRYRSSDQKTLFGVCGGLAVSVRPGTS